MELAFSDEKVKFRRRVILAVSECWFNNIKDLITLWLTFRNMLTHLQALLASGCLVMLFLVTLLDLLLVKNKITFSGFSGSVHGSYNEKCY